MLCRFSFFLRFANASRTLGLWPWLFYDFISRCRYKNSSNSFLKYSLLGLSSCWIYLMSAMQYKLLSPAPQIFFSQPSRNFLQKSLKSFYMYPPLFNNLTWRHLLLVCLFHPLLLCDFIHFVYPCSSNIWKILQGEDSNRTNHTSATPPLSQYSCHLSCSSRLFYKPFSVNLWQAKDSSTTFTISSCR